MKLKIAAVVLLLSCVTAHEVGEQKAVTDTMLAAFVTSRPSPGTFVENLKLGQVPKPNAKTLGPREVLVHVKAASINVDDIHLKQGSFIGGMPYLQGPEPAEDNPVAGIPGSDLAGVVVAVGANVTAVKKGDRVCSLQDQPLSHRQGGWAEYVVAEEETVALIPDDLSFVGAAALVMPTFVAAAMVEAADVPPAGAPPFRCVVVGASGGIGSVLVQLLRSQGDHVHIVAVSSSSKSTHVRELGANDVVDYTKGPFHEQLASAPKFDCVFDLVGGRDMAANAASILAPGTGVFVTATGPEAWVGTDILSGFALSKMAGAVLWNLLWNYIPGSHPRYAFATPTVFGQETIDSALAAGVRPAVSKEVPFTQEAVREAVALVASHKAHGKVVINLEKAK